MPTSRPSIRADLEALRGLAVVLVVAYHAGVPALAGGFVGVDVFFVLSGYLATRLLVREYAATGTIDVAAAYGRRALRLLPALWAVVAATLALAWALLPPIDRADVAATARAVVLGTANHHFAREAVDYFASADSPFLHTWTLGVELQVSLLWPPLLLLLATLGAWGAARRRGGVADDAARRADGLLRGMGPGLALVGLGSLVAAVRLTEAAPAWAFFGTAARAWEFAAGGLLALALTADAAPAAAATPGVRTGGWWAQAAGLGLLALVVALYDRAMPYPGLAALLPVAGALAVVAGGARGAGPLAGDGRLLGLLRALGGLSYAWYLWHWPLVVIGVALAPGLGTGGRLAWSLAALGPAWLTRRWIERPARHAPLGRSPWWPAAAAAASLVAAAGIGALRDGAARRARAPDQRAWVVARRDRVRHACWAEASAVVARPGCTFGDPRGTVTVALFGDSHAEHWLAALDRLGRERGWRVVLLVKGGCPVADAPELMGRRRAWRGRECRRHREAAIRRLVALRPAVAVLSSWDEYVARDEGEGAERAAHPRVPPASWERGLARTYGRLAAAGVPVVALRGTPRTGFDVPACLSARTDARPFAPACTYAREDGLHAAARVAQDRAVRTLAARGLPVRAVDMADRVCAASPCPVVQGGQVVFTDDNHLAAGFTRASAGVLGARLDAALATMGRRLP
jgi:peptidoglycan/LPS O-acetylase OafA/YrhL